MFRVTITTTVLALLLSAASSVHAASWGNLTGTFKYDGEPPKPVPVKVNKDVETCGKHKLVEEYVVVNPGNGGLQNVIVFLYTKRGAQPPTAHPAFAANANAIVTLDNARCRFEPRIVLLRTTQTLLVGNNDPAGHNTNISSFSNPGINPIVPAGGQVMHKMAKAESLPVPVVCNIHPWMGAYIVVKDHPYMAVSDKDGKFNIQNLPTGKHTFRFWHEEPGYVKKVKVNGKGASWKKGRVTIDIKEGNNDMGEILFKPVRKS